jgi:signal transduction histidine kinase
MSIRLRLTLLYGTILALTLLVLGLALYRTLVVQTEAALGERSLELARRIAQEGVSPFPGTGSRESRSFGERDFVVQREARDGSRDDDGGTSSEDSIDLPLSEEGRERVLEGHEVVEEHTVGGETALIVAVPARADGETRAIVLVGRSIAEQQQSFAVLRSLLMIGGSSVLVLGLGAGWLMAGAALRPIDRITQTARAIELERDFSRRVDDRGPRDEVGRLATTLNSMLGALQSAFQQQAQALQAQRRFVADASHELRTPLTTIRGNLALLQRDPPIDEADRSSVLADSIDECERLSRLVADLLALARADAGGLLALECVDLAAVGDAVCRRAQLHATGHTVTFQAAAPVCVRANRDAVTQIVTALLDNALKHTPAGRAIDIRVAGEPSFGSISVRDNGPGIAPNLLAHIFERFVRGDAARTGEGAGLGLSIAHALAEAQGGALEAESTLGQGSMFTLRLPLAEVL